MSELYLFTDGATNYAFTPTLLSKTLNSITYIPTIIKRDEIILTNNFAKSNVKFHFNKGNTFALLMVNTFAERIITIKIYKDNLIYWQGAVENVSIEPTEIAIDCTSLYNNIRRRSGGPTLAMPCWKTIYDQNCTVLEADFDSVYSGVTANRNTITISSLTETSGFFNNGIAKMGGQIRRIVLHTGTTITLAEAFTGVLTGSITLLPGCNLTQANCTLFNNLNNFGGFAYIAPKDPFGSTGLL